MIEQFFDEYNISESELKDKIYETLCELHRLRPEKWTSNILDLVTPDQPSIQILNALLKASPKQIETELNSNRVTTADLLKIASFSVDTTLKDIHLENLLFEQHLRHSLQHFHKMIFTFICLILVEERQGKINFDRYLIYDLLDQKVENLTQSLEMVEAMVFVKKLLNDFTLDENNKFYTEKINTFIASVGTYIHENCLENALLSTVNLFAEAHLKYLNNIGFSKLLTKEDKSEIITKIKNFNNKTLSKRLEIKQGGARKREGFVWTDECKIDFYKTLENLPKIEGKQLWIYAFEELNKKDFNYKFIEYLRTETVFKEVSERLFREAVKTWGKYKDSFNKPSSQEKPVAFALKHSLLLLDYPKTKYSTMKNITVKEKSYL